MYRITGHMQNYAWGVVDGLRPWVAEPTPGPEVAAGEPQAELWFGAHQNGPSPVVGAGGKTLRDEVDPARVPLLVKLLAAAKPLSLQVHPPLEQALRGFAEQRSDPAVPKLLSDPMAKSEIIIAVKPFSALQGFRDFELSARILTELGDPALDAAQSMREGDPLAAIRQLLAIPVADLGPACDRLPVAAAAAGLLAPGVEALSTVVANYPADPGVLVAALLDHRVLAVGEAVYVPAGVVHAYVSGTGVEVMTSSDNVLRLGLTTKQVAVDAALRATRPELEPVRLDPEPVELPDGGRLRHYSPAGAPFSVAWLTGGETEFAEPHYRLVLALEGDVCVSGTAGAHAHLEPGQAMAVMDDDGPVFVSAGQSALVATPSGGS